MHIVHDTEDQPEKNYLKLFIIRTLDDTSIENKEMGVKGRVKKINNIKQRFKRG